MYTVTLLDTIIKAFAAEEDAQAYRNQLEDFISHWPRIIWANQTPPLPLVKWVEVE